MKLLILFPRRHWEEKVSFVRRSAIRAMLDDWRLECHLTGQGWDDWNDALTVQQNADRLLPGAEAVFSYKSQGHAKRHIQPVKDIQGFRGERIESFNECHDPSIVYDAVNAGTTLAILHLANSEKDWIDSGVRTAVVPHCADADRFCPVAKPWKERDIPVLLTGTLSDDPYPLRARLAGLIRSNKIPGYIHPHPGNYMPCLELCDRQEREYAALLGRAKIHLTCSSVYRYALAKYKEAAMAGCCVMGDLPETDIEEHRLYMRVIDNSMTDDELVAAIQNAIDDDAASQRLAHRGQLLMLERYTMEDYVTRFIDAVQGGA